jgi:alcohol dehydrogenase class IV
MPKFLTATTGMDALTHAVEAYIGRSKTKLTSGAAEKSVKLIFENLEVAYQNGDNLEARKNMLEASYLAGIAFTRSYVGYVHAIAHTLGGKYDVPHGLANAVLLPHILRAYGERATKPLSMLAKAVGLVEESTAPETAAEAFITRVGAMNARMEIPTTLDCIQKEDIPTMARLAEKEGNPLYPVPVLWDVEDIEKIYYKVGGIHK